MSALAYLYMLWLVLQLVLRPTQFLDAYASAARIASDKRLPSCLGNASRELLPMPCSWTSLARGPRHHWVTMARSGLAGKWVLEAVQDDYGKAADIAMYVVGVGVVDDDDDRDEEVAVDGDESCRETAVVDGVM